MRPVDPVVSVGSVVHHSTAPKVVQNLCEFRTHVEEQHHTHDDLVPTHARSQYQKCLARA
eukprot:2135185-Rhodomonas_salina.2